MMLTIYLSSKAGKQHKSRLRFIIANKRMDGSVCSTQIKAHEWCNGSHEMGEHRDLVRFCPSVSVAARGWRVTTVHPPANQEGHGGVEERPRPSLPIPIGRVELPAFFVIAPRRLPYFSWMDVFGFCFCNIEFER